MRGLIFGLAFAASCTAAFAAPPGPYAIGRSQPPAAFQPPSCPAEQLSCGLQTPVTSDGARPFVNHVMGLRAIFPAGSHVCMSRSGDSPRGFYAWYGKSVAGCPEGGHHPVAAMGISSSFNPLYYKSLRQVSPDCRPLSSAVRANLHGSTLVIAGHRSLACQAEGQNGAVEITVYALAGTIEEGAPSVIYFAFLDSKNERLNRDLVTFQTFLGRLRIGVR